VDSGLLACSAVSLGMWCLMLQRIVMPSSPRVEGSKKNALNVSPLQMKAIQIFEMFGNTQPMTECHIPEYLYPQLERNVICHSLTHNPLTAKHLLQYLQK